MPRAALSLIAPLALALALVVAASVQFAQPSDLQEAAEHIAQAARPGDLVVLYPEGRALDLRHFEGLDAVAASETFPELDRYSRVALVRELSDAPPSFRRRITSRGHLLSSQDFGGVTVDWIQLEAPPIVVMDMTENIERARVVVVEDGEEAECPWSADRFDCLDAPWTYVGETQQTFEGQPHRCVWAHPIEDATLRIELPAADGADRLVGWYGLTDYAVSTPDGGPVTLRVETSERTRTVRVRQIAGRIPLDLPLGDDGTATLRVSSRTPGVRHLCFDLQAVRSAADTSAALPAAAPRFPASFERLRRQAMPRANAQEPKP